MSAPKERKSLSFKENEYKFLKICSIGYNNYTDSQTGEFLGVNRWHALYYLRSGKGSFYLRGKNHEVRRGDLFFISPNEPWKIHFESDETWEYYWIAFSADYAQEIIEILGFTLDEPARAAKVPQRIDWIFDSLMAADSATPEVYFTALASLMQILSVEFSKSGVSSSTLHHKELAENIQRIIDLNFKNPDFSVNVAAQMLYMSHSQMSRVFKEVTGMTPVAYLVDMRLNFAAELLKERDISVKELCTASGFSDSCHFMKKFKLRFGMTVRDWRKQFIERQY